MLPRRIEVALRGDLEKFMRDELKKAERAVTEAVKAETIALRDALRDQVIAAGLGQGLAKAWRYEVFPKGGTSLGAAGVLYSKAPHIHSAFDRGETVRSPNGFWLAIPTENAPRRARFRPITPSTFPEATLGKLRLIAPKGRRDVGFLVVDKVRRGTGKRGGFRKASKRALKQGDFENAVIMFVLIPEARMKKKTDVAAAAAAAEARLPRRIDREFARLDAMDGSGE